MNPSANRSSAEGWIRKCAGSSLVLLPEMFTTGFCMTPSDSSKGWQETVDWMADMARRYDVAIGGGVAVEECGNYYNRFYVVDKRGQVTHYDKRHLFSFAGEDKAYSGGERRVVVEIEGVRVLLLTCYDLRFPVWGRNRGDYDVMVCIASWPSSRRGAWDTLLRCRAIENLAYVCGVNIVGSDPNCQYSGGTAAIDYKGNTISAVEDNTTGVATIEIDMKSLQKFRDKFPALSDADNFEIKNKHNSL